MDFSGVFLIENKEIKIFHKRHKVECTIKLKISVIKRDFYEKEQNSKETIEKPVKEEDMCSHDIL